MCTSASMCVGSFYILLVDNDMFMFTTTKSNVGFCIATKFDNKHPTIVLRYFKENSYSKAQRTDLSILNSICIMVCMGYSQ